MNKHELGDIIEVVIILAVLAAGLIFTIHGFMSKSSISGSSGRYYEVYGD